MKLYLLYGVSWSIHLKFQQNPRSKLSKGINKSPRCVRTLPDRRFMHLSYSFWCSAAQTSSLSGPLPTCRAVCAAISWISAWQPNPYPKGTWPWTVVSSARMSWYLHYCQMLRPTSRNIRFALYRVHWSLIQRTLFVPGSILFVYGKWKLIHYF